MIFDPNLPLSGKTVVLTRSKDQLAEARFLFESKGAKVLDLPALVICPPDNWHPLDEALLELESFHWIIFSSANGVKAVEQRLQLIGQSLAKLPNSIKIAAMGNKTAKLLKSINVEVEFVPSKFVADDLISNFPTSVHNLKFLIPRVQSGGRTVLLEYLVKEGAKVIEVPAYESKCPKEMPRAIINAFKSQSVDAMVFTSSKTAAHTAQLFRDCYGEFWKKFLFGVKFVSIGPQTTISCKKYFNKIDEEASVHNLEGVLAACIKTIVKDKS